MPCWRNAGKRVMYTEMEAAGYNAAIWKVLHVFASVSVNSSTYASSCKVIAACLHALLHHSHKQAVKVKAMADLA